MNEYTKQANDFAKKHGVKLTVISEDYRKYFTDDKQARSVFKMRIERNGKQYTFDFGQSIVNSGIEPTMYDVLTCLTKYDVGTFEDFCGDFGYDNDSIKAFKTYKAVLREWKAVDRLFGDVLEELEEIS